MKIQFAVLLVLLAAPRVAAGQAVTVQGALGSHVNGGGNSQSLSLGISVGDRVDFLISAERSHLPTDVTRLDDRVVGTTRGGTTRFVSGEVRFFPLTFPGPAFSPYVLAGAGRGVSRPNVNEFFPDPVRNDATLFVVGGGVRVPLTDHLSAFVDLRFVIQSELDSAILLTPVRGGLSWRF
jgi:hypothetical protein